jgi:hypothetical protein
MKGERDMALSEEEREALMGTLKARFDRHIRRHRGIEWAQVQARLDAHPDKLSALAEMERTGGEPDVVGHDPQSGEVIFFDCAPESPEGRRSLCYDGPALDARREAKPHGTAVDMAAAIGIDLLTEEQYRHLQTLGEFDLKTSSWLKTPQAIRQHGGAIFGDRRYDHVFMYHNGASSYYASRGFRGALRV